MFTRVMRVRFGAARHGYDGGPLQQAGAGHGVAAADRRRREHRVRLLGALRARQQLRRGGGLERDTAGFQVRVQGYGHQGGGWRGGAAL